MSDVFTAINKEMRGTGTASAPEYGRRCGACGGYQNWYATQVLSGTVEEFWRSLDEDGKPKARQVTKAPKVEEPCEIRCFCGKVYSQEEWEMLPLLQIS